jgi:hypothetical protein
MIPIGMKFKGSGEIKVLRLSSMPAWDMTKALARQVLYCNLAP